MSANQTIVADIQSLSPDEMAEQYRRLADSYRTLKRAHESELQSSYEIRRNYQTATESAAYMTTELESIDSVHKEELAKLREKYVQTLTTLKDANVDLKQQNSSLETSVEDLHKVVEQLKEKIELLEAAAIHTDSVAGNDTLSSEKEAFLERENEELKQIVSEQQEKIDTLMLQMVNGERKLDNFKEKLECIEDNLSSKRQELEELQAVLESTQEENMRLNSELAALQSTPEDANKKGNSLFAEVDDQRQRMIDLLQTQRKRYQDMKKLHGQSQLQIRRLTRENQELCDEIKTCSELFITADSSFRNESSKQIGLLGEEIKRLRDQLASAERRLVDKASGMNWVDPFVSFYKNESATLKNQLFQLQMAKRLVDEVCWEAQHDLAKWRFEALKSRYIIINRESLLEEHAITYARFDSMEARIHIDEVMVSKAKPHVGFSMGTCKTGDMERNLKDLDLLADLHIDIPSFEGSHKPTTVLLPPPPPPPPSSTVDSRHDVKEEILTPLATPLVTPVHSPKSMKKEAGLSTAEKTNFLAYRDIVFIPKDAPLTDSLKKKQFVEMIERTNKSEETSKKHMVAKPCDEDKENVAQAEKVSVADNQQPSQTKSWGWISEKRTKNNVVVRRFKLPERQNAVAAQKE